MQTEKDVTLEEKEVWLLDREAVLEGYERHTKIERVINHYEDDEGAISYFIKCKPILQSFYGPI